MERPSHRSASAPALLAALTLAVPSPLASQQYTLDDWMTVSSVSSFELSPDGRFIYYTSNAAPTGTDEIFRIPVSGGRPTLLTRERVDERPEPKEQLVVAPDGETLYFTSARYFQAYLNVFRMPAAGGPAEPLTFNDAMIQTSPTISPDGRTLAFYARTGSGTEIFAMDLDGPPSWPRMLFPGLRDERSPSWSPRGGMAFAMGGDIWVVDRPGEEPRRVVEDAYAGGNGLGAWSPDGGRIAFITGGSGFAQIGVVDVATGEVTPITYAPNEHGDVSWSPDGEWLVFVRNDDLGMSQEVVMARSDGSGTPRLLTNGRGRRSGPKLTAGGRVIFIEETSTRTRDLWSVPVTGGPATQLTNSMGRIDPGRLRAAEEVFYAGPDNLRIPAMLWRPPDFDPARRYPVLVRLHGHPGQWNHSFRMMTQYFVSHGFVAVAPNPRGSVGFGAGFHDLHIADYGGVELQDVMGVIPFLDSLGYIDMNRKATWGGSGGGYMSLVIATEEPEAFEAQVIRAPVSDWQLLAIDRYAASGRAWTANRTPRRERSEFGGPYEEIPGEYERRSPVNFAEAVTVPQLLFQGLRDTSVPPRQSQVWVDRMRALGKDHLVDFVEYPDEVHSLRRYKATVRDRLERMEAFFAEHLNLSGGVAGS